MNNQEQRLRRYLLGEMPETERTALEQEYFSDQRLFELMVQVENELVDKYARGLLRQPTRDRFEQFYLAHPKRRERAKFAETLVAKLEQTDEVAAAPAAHVESLWHRWLASMRGPRLAWTLSLALLLIASVTALFLFQTRRSRQERLRAEAVRSTQEQQLRESQPQVANVRPPSEQPSVEVERTDREQQVVAPVPSPTVKPEPMFVSLTLTVAGTRGAVSTPQTLVIPARTEQVRLKLNIRENDYLRYSVALQPAGGKEIFTRQHLTPKTTKSGASLAFIIPAQKFTAGDYILTLRGVNEAGEIEDVSKSLLHVERE
jgi:hypothetical protein